MCGQLPKVNQSTRCQDGDHEQRHQDAAADKKQPRQQARPAEALVRMETPVARAGRDKDGDGRRDG
eukprot:CAMPEP_0202795486 /NCGR_PEP_ID=MMETSP1388-20130828/90083_1 /ASSEMBLY_ACC=CAM_ASM_000864 /TAXON_ID=37098 /ORGANISM="Isochrysis sp, Strain CCMP1244" /LENGTH=65 /DNA_ID=CAMNT_0049465359 /DNA_START=213 /DNA_END=408 /DNA_ORIENTATION=+